MMIAFMVIFVPMMIAFGPVAPFFIRLMLVMPVVPVPFIMAIPDELLPAGSFSPEMVIIPAVLVKVQVRLGFIHHYFVGVIEIEIMITGGQLMRKGPMPSVEVNKLMVRYIVIRLNIRNIIIFHMIVTGWSPGRLNAEIDGKADLCVRRI